MAVFTRSAYDVIKIRMPINGMNQSISPEELDLSYAYILENIIPRPYGDGQVRHGTSKQFALPKHSKITGLFPYVSRAGDNQLLLYANSFTADGTAQDFVVEDDLEYLSFTTNNLVRYKKDLRLKLSYREDNKIVTLIDNIKEIVVADI